MDNHIVQPINIGIIGFGKLGKAIVPRLASHPGVDTVYVSRRTNDDAAEYPGNVNFEPDNCTLAELADVIIICVKPSQMERTARSIASRLRPDTLVVTCAASISIYNLKQWIEGRSVIIRAMPNIPCRVGEGMIALAFDEQVTPLQVELIELLFAKLGRTAIVEESLMDAATAISGCGPAYAYMVMEALIDAGVKLGLPRHVARLLVAQTVAGSAKVLLESDCHPAALRDEVTTPAGRTIDALIELEDGKLRHTLLRAALAAARNSGSILHLASRLSTIPSWEANMPHSQE